MATLNITSLPPDVAKQIIADNSPYNYIPSKAVAIIMIVLFGISTMGHLAEATLFRTWWLLPTAFFCGIIELLGWSGRVWSSISPLLEIPFQIQISCTIIAPTPLLAANFVIFGRIIERLGSQYSRLTPKWYTIIFCTCDVISLVIQGVGGGMAAQAKNLRDANKGGNIMLGGIAFQLAVIVGFSFCAVEYFIRYFKRTPIRPTARDGRGVFTQKLKLMTCAMAFVTLVLFIRAIYRTIELSDGWNGRIIATEVYFNVLDGAMVILAIYTYNFFHPGILLNEVGSTSSSDEVAQVHVNAPKELKNVESA